jgi:hypothetical protein
MAREGLTSGSNRTLQRWVIACAVACTVGACMGYVNFAAGPIRLVVDGILIGTFQALALGTAVRRQTWIPLTVAALLLSLVAGIALVLVIGTVLGALERTNFNAYVTIVYGLAAAGSGAVVGLVQRPALLLNGKTWPWLAGNALGAAFVFPALIASVFSPENTSSVLPLWVLGLGGGLVYGIASGLGLKKSDVAPRR